MQLTGQTAHVTGILYRAHINDVGDPYDVGFEVGFPGLDAASDTDFVDAMDDFARAWVANIGTPFTVTLFRSFRFEGTSPEESVTL